MIAQMTQAFSDATDSYTDLAVECREIPHLPISSPVEDMLIPMPLNVPVRNFPGIVLTLVYHSVEKSIAFVSTVKGKTVECGKHRHLNHDERVYVIDGSLVEKSQDDKVYLSQDEYTVAKDVWHEPIITGELFVEWSPGLPKLCSIQQPIVVDPSV